MLGKLAITNFGDNSNRRHRVLTFSVLATLVLGATLSAMPMGNSLAPAVPQSSGIPDLGKLPLHFEPNVGQADLQARFITRVPGGTLYFTPSEVVLSLQAGSVNDAVQDKGSDAQTLRSDTQHSALSTQHSSSVVRMQFVGASPGVRMERGPFLPGKINYLIGNDPSKWHTNVPTHSEIAYMGLYPGVDLSYGGVDGQLKGTYTVAAGVDPALISWSYMGAQGVKVDEVGNLLITLPNGPNAQSDSSAPTPARVLTEQAPVAWQEIGGRRVMVQSSYLLRQDGSIGFSLGQYDPTHPLTIDPTLTLPYSTYLGGNGSDGGSGIAVDASGNAYVTGSTDSTNFPTLNPYQGYQGGGDAFVTKLGASGSALVYSTYLGGNGSDEGYDIAVDASGNAYVTGSTDSTNFPTLNPYQGYQGYIDAFVTKLNASGSALVYSTYLGGNSNEEGLDIAIDASGNAYVTGITLSTNFPLNNQYQGDQTGADVFVAKLNTNATGNASLVYSTYLGGSGYDGGSGIAVDASGNAYVTGRTGSTNFPTLNPYQGEGDAFVTKLGASGSALVYSTYLGGSDYDGGSDIAVDASGNAYVTGSTGSANFPILAPYQVDAGQGEGDAFVTKLGASGSALVYSTYLGGNGGDGGSDIAVDSSGNAYVTGSTESTNFPLNNQYQGDQTGDDAFVAKLSFSDPGNPTPTPPPSASPTPTTAPGSFSDVPPGSTFYSFVNCLVDRGIISGYSDGTFRAQNQITRGQIAKIVSNSEGYADNVTGMQTYADVPSTQPFHVWIERLSMRGHMGGYNCGGAGEPCDGANRPYFRPGNNASRGQLSKIVSNAAGFDDTPAGQTFEDVPTNSTFYVYIERLTGRGVMGGYECGRPDEPCVAPNNRPYFRPSDNVTRGQGSKIVANTFFPDCETARP
ncbi:MAG TPA: SBBP repeat-containing protein [Chloroflexia bacterium]